MISSPSDRRKHQMVSAAVAVLLLTGCSTPTDTSTNTGTGSGTSAAPTATQSAAPGSSAAATPPTAATNAPTLAPAPQVAPAPEQPAVLPASAPVSFSIPSVGAQSELLSTGLRDNGSLEVPPDGPGAPASWYNQSPTPGERGPAVLLGHVNATDGGPGIFADLRWRHHRGTPRRRQHRDVHLQPRRAVP